MLKNSKIGFKWIFNIIRYLDNLMFLISVVLSLVCVCVFLFLEFKTAEG